MTMGLCLHISSFRNGKGLTTGNDMDNLKELKKKISRFKSNIKALNKKVTSENDEGDDKYEPEDDGDQFEGSSIKISLRKFDY